MDPNAGAKAAFPGRLIPASRFGSAVAGGLATVLLALLFVAFGTLVLRTYGLALFVGVPFLMGLFSTLIYGYHAPRGLSDCLGVSFLSVALLGLALVLVALEGVVCILMAAPFALGLAAIGGLLGYLIQAREGPRRKFRGTGLLLFLGLPFLMGAEAAVRSEPPLLAVRSAIEIDAPPDRVWRHVIAFSELPPPDEWIFKTGIAYPLRAEIHGRGPGAVRHCVFSTGPFVEPIEIWDEPRLLAFGVESQPVPMVETTPYPGIHPPHLDDHFVSRRGQFLLEPLPGGRTRLEGTTWYFHRLWPEFYWTLWSDAILHRIHLRVLKHVKALSEQQEP